MALACAALSALEQLIGRGHTGRGREPLTLRPASKTRAHCDRLESVLAAEGQPPKVALVER